MKANETIAVGWIDGGMVHTGFAAHLSQFLINRADRVTDVIAVSIPDRRRGTFERLAPDFNSLAVRQSRPIAQRRDLAVGIALARDGEVVNLDASQVYRGMDIGTAKPTPEERVGTARLDRPVDHLAVRLRDVDVQPAMRVNPFHLRELAFEGDRLCRIEFR